MRRRYRNPDDTQLRKLENKAISDPSEINLIRYIQSAKRSKQVNNDLVAVLFTKHLEEEIIPSNGLANEIIIDLVFPYVQKYTYEQSEQIRNQLSNIRNTPPGYNRFYFEAYSHISLSFFEIRTIMSDIIHQVINGYLTFHKKESQRDLSSDEDRLLKKHFVIISDWVKSFYVENLDFDWQSSSVDESTVMNYINMHGFDDEIIGPYEGYGAGRINDFTNLPNTDNYSDVEGNYFDFSTILTISSLANHSIINEWTDHGSSNSYFDLSQRDHFQNQWEEEENWRNVQNCEVCGEDVDFEDDFENNICANCTDE